MDRGKAFTYFNPTRIVFGAGSLDSLPSLIAGHEKKNVLLVTGKKAMDKHGHLNRVMSMLSDHDILVYNEVSPNPDGACVEQGVEYGRQNSINLVIGLGGGSSIDTAKSIAFLINQTFSLHDYLKSDVSNIKRSIPFIAVPTTAGAGSEVTKWATLWNHQDNVKHSIEHEYMFPGHAIIDANLHITTPTDVTAAAGMDSLCHAIESFWSNKAQPVSDMFALKAMELIVQNIENAYRNPDSLDSREAMALGALYAGLAFSNTRTSACHSISYPITSRFGVAHGHACALTLSSLLHFNAPFIQGKAALIASAFSEVNIEDTSSKINQLMERLGLETKLSDLNITRSDVQFIINNGFTPERVNNNPRKIEREDLEAILEEIL